MYFEIFVILFLISLTLLGLFFIYISFSGWNPSYTPKKMLARLIKEILGYTGTRFFVGIVGLLFLFLPMFIFLNKQFGLKLPDRITSKDNTVIIISKFSERKSEFINGQIVIRDELDTSETTRSGTLSQITDHIKYNKSDLKMNILKISFKNNYLQKVPDLIWELYGLQEIDFENNDLDSIPIDKLKALKKLKKINLKNNPILKENLDKIQSLKYIEIIR